ncbi:MAG: hypothetical protein U0871_24825 [Gemmataceae bacterium]
MDFTDTERRRCRTPAASPRIQVHGGRDYTKQYVRYRNVQVKDLSGKGP